MEQRSTHYGDVAKWIEKVIDSCETYQQTFTAKQLIRNFEKQLIRSTPDKYWRDYRYSVIRSLEHKLLEHKLDNKRNSFIDKIEE
jgi:hypothetical protein